MIEPTIGRKVWYRSGDKPQADDKWMSQIGKEQPFDATVVFVHADDEVNLVVFDHDGHLNVRSHVKLIQDDAVKPEEGPYCEWMPYQKGQAAKLEELKQTTKDAGQIGQMVQMVQTPPRMPHQSPVGTEPASAPGLGGLSLQEGDKLAEDIATGPRVRLEDIDNAIQDIYYATGEEVANNNSSALSVLTVCLVEMKNGYTIVGKSAPASPQNFNQALGRTLAREDAIRQIWPLMGFALREKLHNTRL